MNTILIALVASHTGSTIRTVATVEEGMAFLAAHARKWWCRPLPLSPDASIAVREFNAAQSMMDGDSGDRLSIEAVTVHANTGIYFFGSEAVAEIVSREIGFAAEAQKTDDGWVAVVGNLYANKFNHNLDAN